MKMARAFIVGFFLVAISIAAFLLVASAMAVGQATDAPRQSATAHIPYDFWIGAINLPAGDYTISPDVDLVVRFHNVKTKEDEVAYLVPASDNAATVERKLVFVVREGKRYLREVWSARGRQIVNSEFDLPAGTRTSEVRLVAHKPKSSEDAAPESEPANCAVGQVCAE